MTRHLPTRLVTARGKISSTGTTPIATLDVAIWLPLLKNIRKKRKKWVLKFDFKLLFYVWVASIWPSLCLRTLWVCPKNFLVVWNKYMAYLLINQKSFKDLQSFNKIARNLLKFSTKFNKNVHSRLTVNNWLQFILNLCWTTSTSFPLSREVICHFVKSGRIRGICHWYRPIKRDQGHLLAVYKLPNHSAPLGNSSKGDFYSGAKHKSLNYCQAQ